MNKVYLFGHLGKDVELAYTPQGTAVAKFSVATTERYKKGDEWVEQTDWHNIVVWGKLAEICGQYLKKGSKPLIEGKVRTRSYEKNGEKKYVTEIIAERVEFPGKSEGGDARTQHHQDGSRSGAPAATAPKDDEDIPF